MDLESIAPLLIATSVGLVALVSRTFSSIQSFIARKQIEKANSKIDKEPGKVRPAWEIGRITLENYFNRNLSQISAIFYLSVFVMLVGFFIIAYGIYEAFQTQNISIATIATIAGLITEFIGATFIFIYRSTIQQASNYTQTLERINSVGMAMQILDTMPDEIKNDDIKSKTKAILVELLVKQANQPTIKANEPLQSKQTTTST